MLKGWESGKTNETTDTDLLRPFTDSEGKINLTIRKVNETLAATKKQKLSNEELWQMLGDEVWKYNTDKLSESDVLKIWEKIKDKQIFVNRLFGTGKDKKQNVTVSQLSEFNKSELKDGLTLEAFQRCGKSIKCDEDKNTVSLEPIRKVLRKRENVAKEEDTI